VALHADDKITSYDDDGDEDLHAEGDAAYQDLIPIDCRAFNIPRTDEEIAVTS
jgi:hypothetical protein